jgi:hypothetical protein
VTFQLPDELPITPEELTSLREKATGEITEIQRRYEAGEDLADADVESLNSLLDAVTALDTALAAAEADAEAHRAAVAEAIERSKTATEVAAPEEEETVEEIEVVETEVVAEPVAVAAAVKAPVTFAGAGVTETPAEDTGPGWEMVPGAPGYRAGKIGFKEMGIAIDSVRGHNARVRSNRADVRSMAARGLAQLSRNMTVVQDSHELVREIERATSEIPGHGKVTAESLTAAGGWCAPSEQLYTFCDVPEATDLISLPEISINRGGIRWPVEPDLSEIFKNFEFFFTEPELEAVDADGHPTAVKHCVEVPCPDEFVEMRLNAVGYCVEAGILQRQGWPESIEWFLRSLTQEHLRAMSRRTILDMIAGSETVTFTGPSVNATSGVLNAIALMATNLRLNRGLGRSATIEGVAPNWLHEVLRADLAMQQGGNMLSVSDGQINSWLNSRNISLQYVGDWQTRGPGEPGSQWVTQWPTKVNILLYPAGTWFRSMSNIIEVGVLYPKEQLQINRYTEFFTEDAIAVGKRCNHSLNVEIPICPTGGYGAPVEITCA